VNHIDIDNRKKEIKNEISALNKEYRELSNNEIEYCQEKLKPLVGLCFKNGNGYAVITDVPQVEYTMMDTHFNPYRLPVLVIGKEFTDELSIVPYYEATVYSLAVNYDDPEQYFRLHNKIISKEEFVDRLNEALKKMRKEAFREKE